MNFFQNHHRKYLDKVALSKFENCPNLKKIEIRNLDNFYNKGLFKIINFVKNGIFESPVY